MVSALDFQSLIPSLIPGGSPALPSSLMPESSKKPSLSESQ